MNQLYKGKAKYILAGAMLLLFTAITLYANTVVYTNKKFSTYLTIDTVPKVEVKNATVKNNEDRLISKSSKDTVIVPKIDTLQFKSSKDSLDAPVTYHADDSMVLDMPTKKIILYGKEAKVNYIDNELMAPHIDFDQQTGIVSAYLVKDSTGKVISMPIFNQADFKSVSDSIKFNMKTGKGITKGTYTTQSEMYVYGGKIKMVDANVFYAQGSRFTTCNLDTPHFAFVSKKVKFINKKMAFTGPVHPEFEGVPVPIVLPFGIYPLSKGRHSGLIAPTFTANAQLGLALEGIGYYKILSDNWDVVTRGTIYSYGGWTANINPRYYKRYRYQGNLMVNLQHIKDLDNAGSRGFNVQWDHNADTKSRPGVSFRAHINAGSSRFNQNVPNSPQRRFDNTFGSSIAYTKVWKGKNNDNPYNIAISANHNQNINTKYIQVNFPDVIFNVNTLYPFRKKVSIGESKWYENIGIAYNNNVKSQSFFYDTAGNIGKQFIDKLQWGASHNVPINLSLPPVGPLQIAPTVSYAENWFQNKVQYKWNSANKKLDTLQNKGFYTSRDMSFGFSVNTRIFGMMTFKKGSKVQAIRHEIRPSIGLNYHPNFNAKNYYWYQYDTTGKHFTRTSYYAGGQNIYSPFGEGKQGNIGFNLDNIVQMKVRNKKDTAEGGVKKISLIDGLSLSGSYDLLADSFKLKTFNFNFRTNLFDKIDIGASAVTMPYTTNSNGDFVDKLVWTKKPLSFGALLGGQITVSSSFHGGDKKEKNVIPGQQQLLTNPISGMPLDEYQQEAAYITNNPGQYANFNIPWSVNFAYSLQFTRMRNSNNTNYIVGATQNITGGGSLNLTAKWQMGMNTSFDITNKELGLITMYLTREMHCWQMSINLSNSQGNNYFNISISPKSGILRDLKINRTRYSYEL